MSTYDPRQELQAVIEAGTMTAALLQQSLERLSLPELAKLFRWLAKRRAASRADSSLARDDALLPHIVAIVETRLLRQPPVTDQELRESLRDFYQDLPADSPGRGAVLRILAALAGPAELAQLAELLAADPPASTEACALGISPLFRRKQYDPQQLFPRLLDTLLHQQAAATVLDLLNYLTRVKLTPAHPALHRSQQLSILLGEVAGRLMTIEERREAPDRETQQQVRESISLIVALCDALALIGDRGAVGKLRQALGVAHRRVHTEAAYALAKLGEEEGEQLLLQLAAEPSARLRVLAYAEELDILSQVQEECRTSQARAEAELAVWLAEPMQMGMPPHGIELVDQRQQYWPGYDDLVESYLFRFYYEFPGGQLSNVGIAGPLTMAFSADLGNLPAEAIYAAFAGWHAEHPDIYETPVESLQGSAERVAHQNAARLEAQGFSDIRPVSLGHFFEQRVLIAEARREGVGGIALVDEQEIDWWPTEGKPRPLGAREVYAIYKGKRLLATFNPDQEFD